MKKELTKLVAYYRSLTGIEQDELTNSEIVERFVDSLPKVEATSVRENEESKEVCPHCHTPMNFSITHNCWFRECDCDE